MPIPDRLNVLGPVRAIVEPLVGPFCGKLTSVPGATVAALSSGINAKKSAKLNAPPANPVAPVAPAVPSGPVAPVDPVTPVAPVVPVLPVTPVEPATPSGPSGPTGATGAGSTLLSTQLSSSIALPIGTEVSVLSIPITTIAGQSLKLDSMAEVEITSGASTPNQYTITYSLFLDGTSIASLTVEKNQDNIPLVARTFGEIPNLTWIDSPSAAAHTYEIRITVTGTNISSAVALTRALNIIQF